MHAIILTAIDNWRERHSREIDGHSDGDMREKVPRPIRLQLTSVGLS